MTSVPAIPLATVLALLLAGCAAPVPAADEPAAAFEPAPTPRNAFLRRPATRPPEAPALTKMPLGTGAVPVGTGPVRGSATVGLREAF